MKIEKNSLIKYNYKVGKEYGFLGNLKSIERFGLVLNISKCKLHSKDKDFIFYYEILDLETQNIITPTFDAINAKEVCVWL